jgi:hypothetical protein
MLFYTTIFLACVIAAIIIPWLYRLISDAGKAVHRTILPHSEHGPTSHLRTSLVRHGSTPWDLKNHRAPGMFAKAEQKIASDDSYYGPRNQYSASTQAKVFMPNAGWIHREDKTAFIGNTYKVTRRLKTREKFPKIVSKPESWK